MSTLPALVADLVTANRILADQGVVDAFGHVSVRHPEHQDRYLLSRALSPDLVEASDIEEYALDGAPLSAAPRKPYLERFIHGAIYEARPEVQAVVHSHARSVVPFSVTRRPLRPVMHSCATIGAEVPVWDARRRFGDTSLLVCDMPMGRDLAAGLGEGTVVLMRGHGATVAGRSLKEAVYTAVYLEVNARLQMEAAALGDIEFLSPGEIARIRERLGAGAAAEGYSRAWEYWARLAARRHGGAAGAPEARAGAPG
ncbi:MAG: class II aldolase/adducin family protein [Acetobacteraceae bacterium]|nr:class II aldolase/adducin family protein [Acetobacteraceae bacterium]MDW8397796.1 class II aldolase/adducin family protein [Acetobacteraceae bacterium]